MAKERGKNPELVALLGIPKDSKMSEGMPDDEAEGMGPMKEEPLSEGFVTAVDEFRNAADPEEAARAFRNAMQLC